MHPDDENIIYAGTDKGVYLTTDGGAHWEQINEGLTSRRIASLALCSGENATVFAGTKSAGIFAASPPTGITQRRFAEPPARQITPNPSLGIVKF
ncbi:MAG: WD40/YVTN/BNR-like repeat-containing protein [bacterium]